MLKARSGYIVSCAIAFFSAFGGANVFASTISVTSSAPTPGPNDISQLVNTVAAGGNNVDGKNYYTDNSPPPGQTFTTGSAIQGYAANGLAVYVVDPGTAAAGDSFTVNIMSVNTTSNTVTSVLDTETSTIPSTPGAGNWITMTFANPPTLQANTTYAYDFQRSSGNGHYMGLGASSGNPYSGGQVALLAASNGSAITYGNTGTFDAAFDLQMSVAPEPSCVALLACVGGVLALRRRSLR